MQVDTEQQIVTDILIKNLYVGSDIEFFLKKRASGEIISAEGIVKGSKYAPHYFNKENDKYYTSSLDCVLAEVTLAPAQTDSEFYLNVQKAMRYLTQNMPKDLVLEAIPAARLDDKYLQSEVSKAFGCQSSLNCWTLEEIRPQPTGDNLRSAGFHIHTGYDNPNDETNLMIGKAMDLFLGIPAVIIEPENERKSVGYGCAGNIRFQPWGQEYRVLSSHFASTEKLIKWAFNNTEKAIQFINEGKIEQIMYRGAEIMDCINNTDKELAQQFIKEFQIDLI